MRPDLRRYLALAWLCGVCVATPARAQVGPAPAAAAAETAALPAAVDRADPELDAKARARALYEGGAKAYDEGRYHQAADAFLDANRVYPTPQLSFNVAKAYDRLGHAAGALRYYREYLRLAADAPDFEETSARVRELERVLAERGVQQLTVLSTPDGATVVLDGKPVGVTPWTGETWPGRHRLALALPGYASTDELIEVDAHRAGDASIALAPARTRSELPRPAAPPASELPGVGVLTWTALGVGTAAFGTALALEMAEGENRGISRTGAFFAGLGLAASALGGVLLYVDLHPRRTTPTATHALAVSADAASCRATLVGRF